MGINANKVKSTSARIIVNVARYTFFVAFGFILLYPILYMLSKSFRDVSSLLDPTVVWVPPKLYLGHYKLAIKVLDIPRSFLLTFLYEIGASLIQFCSCAVAAYGLSRFKFRGRGIITGAMILTILVPTIMIVTPSYVNFSRLDFLGIGGLFSELFGVELRPNLIDTPFVFYIPSLFGVGLKGGLFVYIFSQFYKGLPKELEEAASIDGAGPWKTFLKIVVPSSGAAAITVLLFSVVWHWNDYYLASMYLSNVKLLSVNLLNFTPTTLTSYGGIDTSKIGVLVAPTITAGCLLYILPMVIYYLLMQKKFIASVATSGIVG